MYFFKQGSSEIVQENSSRHRRIKTLNPRPRRSHSNSQISWRKNHFNTCLLDRRPACHYPLPKPHIPNKAQKRRADLSRWQKRIKAEGVQAETLLREGDIVDQIVKTAKDGNFNLVVVGARGLSRVKGLLMGSVSNGVTRNAPCPVLVVR